MEMVAAAVLEFENGDISASLLARGEGDKCARVADLVPAVAYSGDKKVTSSRIIIMPAEQWDVLSKDFETK